MWNEIYDVQSISYDSPDLSMDRLFMHCRLKKNVEGVLLDQLECTCNKKTEALLVKLLTY